MPSLMLALSFLLARYDKQKTKYYLDNGILDKKLLNKDGEKQFSKRQASIWLGMSQEEVNRMPYEEYIASQNAASRMKQELYDLMESAVQNGMLKALAKAGILKTKGGGKNG